MPRTVNSNPARLRELSPESLRTPEGHRYISFPSPPPIGTAIVINNHPYEVVGTTPIQDNDGNISPGIIWKSRCQHCESEYEITCGLNWTPTRNCPNHGRDGTDPAAKAMKNQKAREKIIAAAEAPGGINLNKLVTSAITITQLKVAANELEEEGFMRTRRGKKWIYTVN